MLTLDALSVDKRDVAGGVPKTGTAALYGAVPDNGVGPALLELSAGVTQTLGACRA